MLPMLLPPSKATEAPLCTVLSGPALATRGLFVFVVFPLANWLVGVVPVIGWLAVEGVCSGTIPAIGGLLVGIVPVIGWFAVEGCVVVGFALTFVVFPLANWLVGVGVVPVIGWLAVEGVCSGTIPAIG